MRVCECGRYFWGGENLNNKKCVCRLAGVILKKVLWTDKYLILIMQWESEGCAHFL